MLLTVSSLSRTGVIQLDCPSVRHWAYASIFAVDVRFQIRDFFGFVVKPQNGHVWPVFELKKAFSRGFKAQYRPLSSKSIFLLSRTIAHTLRLYN